MSEPRTDSSRIGRATALYLAERGLRVFAGVRKPADGEALVEGLQSGATGSIEPIIIDVAKGDSIAQAATELGERLGGSRLVGLVNNAGIAIGGPQEFMPLEDWRRQFEVNVFGLVDTTQKVLPHLLRSKGRVVNIGSIGGRVATPMTAAYAASKFAVRAITDALRMELQSFGVWTACVEPGAIKTEIWRKADEQIETYAANTPADQQARYRPLFEALVRFSARGAKGGAEPIAVARKVEHALLSSRPRTHYLVGVDAHMLATLRWLLPQRTLEWVMGKMM